jgi:2-keto-4-pentenoate hydratase/2-oxohepta-3-ene-1,7-dioic acid hydratase in catechol pathway
MGPPIVTIDELPDVHASWLRTHVNGDLRQDAPISGLIFDIPCLIHTISETISLEPGDVIATGTPVGAGIGFDPPRSLAPGDRVEVSVDGIGTLGDPVT